APPTITTASLPNGATNQAYNQMIGTSGGTNPLNFTVSSGSLPNGLSLSGNALSGTPTVTGIFNFTIQATDNAGATTSQPYTVTINTAPSITSANNATFGEGSPGNFVVTTGPDFPAATMLSETGALPSGVNFTDNGNGTANLDGTPALGTS